MGKKEIDSICADRESGDSGAVCEKQKGHSGSHAGLNRFDERSVW